MYNLKSRKIEKYINTMDSKCVCKNLKNDINLAICKIQKIERDIWIVTLK